MTTILFVCTGNICRSPMAEGLLRHALLEKRRDVRILSAGLNAIDGQSPSPHAVAALKKVNIDISGQRSRLLTPSLIDSADYVLTMTQGHKSAITRLFSQSIDKTCLLRDFHPDPSCRAQDIPDPIGNSFPVYEQCRDEIMAGIHHLINYLNAGGKAAYDPFGQFKKTMKLAIGSDHAGFELKETIREYLGAQPFEVVDCGTFDKQSTDYPDYADKVVDKIQTECFDRGILVCSTGIGMSIAANRAPGIRAALVQDESTARLCRSHNDANILCLASSTVDQDRVIPLVDTFLSTEFEGERHARRLSKLSSRTTPADDTVAAADPEIAACLRDERRRQANQIELIASENFTSPAVLATQGSVLTNKYAEGYPGKRWYGGCEVMDRVENLAIERAKRLFGAEHANVQPHSGSGANMAVYFAMLQPGDRILTMDLSHGGHLTHGFKVNFSGRFFDVTHYGVSRESELLDYDQLASLAEETRTKMITVGASAYSRTIDFVRLGQIAQANDALLLADIAHIAGLVATGNHPSPIGHADFVTTTTHKTLRGPRGGLILCRKEYAAKIDSQVFPGIQGGPLMHVIAAKAVCLQEAAESRFSEYQRQTVLNAAALAGRLAERHCRVVSGGTDNHLFLVDVGSKGLTGKQCQGALDRAGITVNKNTIPFETRSPFQASGIRLGTPAVTTRGMKEPEMEQIGDWIFEIISNVKDLDLSKKISESVNDLTARFPLPY